MVVPVTVVPAVLSIHQRAAPLDARERLAAALASLAPMPDRVSLSSCHRVELYAVVAPGTTLGDVHATLPLDRIDEVSSADWRVGEEAVRHLCRMAAGLDSAIVGEGQIAGQVRRVHAVAREHGLHPTLDRAFRIALDVARDARALLGGHGRSVGSLAVEDACARVREPHSAVALVIGAGEIGKLSARALAHRVAEVVIANRDVTKARALAETIGGRPVELGMLDAELRRADVVISAADTRGAVLTRALLASRCRERRLVLVDVAVPRSVAADARDLPGLEYVDVDGLAAERAPVAADALERAERLCADAARVFMADLRARTAARTIRAIRDHADDVRRRRVERALRKLGHLPQRDRRIVEALASSIAGALVHSPTITLRNSPGRAEAARALFGLEPETDRS